MNRHVLTVICLFLAICSQAQLKFGVRAAANYSRLSFTDDDFKTKFRPDFAAGIIADYPVSSKLAVQAGLNYSREGSKEERLSNGATGKIWMTYVQLPVLVRYHLAESFFAEAGPQFAALVSAKEKYGTASAKSDIKEYYNTFDFRVPVGIGYSFQQADLAGLSLDLRYSFSINRINKVAVGGGNLRNQVLTLGVNYLF